MATLDLPMHAFETQAKWRQWLDKHHAQETGIWLRLEKKTVNESLKVTNNPQPE